MTSFSTGGSGKAVLPAVSVGLVGSRQAVFQILNHTNSGLHQFGLGTERWMIRTVQSATNYARAAAGRGLRAIVVSARDDQIPRALARATALPVVHIPLLPPRYVPGNPPRRPSRRPIALLSVLAAAEPGAPAAVNPEETFATVALGEAGAKNAALLIVSILALGDERLRAAWQEFRARQTREVLGATLPEIIETPVPPAL